MRTHHLPPWLLQQFFTLMTESDLEDAHERDRRAIQQHAELNFRLNGGEKCGMCSSHVRHVVEVTIERDGQIRRYRCLCTRCFEGERAQADRVTLRLGRATLSYEQRPPRRDTRAWREGRNSVGGRAPAPKRMPNGGVAPAKRAAHA